MKLFTCASCQQTVFFENFQCTKCGHRLAYVPDRGVLTALEPAPAAGNAESDLFVALQPGLEGERYRSCTNSVEYAACNWALPEAEGAGLCRACRLNSTIPNLDDPDAMAAWLKLEAAKRRLLYTLIGLGLPVEGRTERPEGGVAFSFEKEDPASGEKVFTGHNDGLITINVAEADAPFREKVREDLGETYRTLLGHFRHEIGHYYWDRLMKNSEGLPRFRELFGDETRDYNEAVQAHYDNGPPADWSNRFLSPYASMHPWEDWAETWAHYLHMVDTLETARSFGIALRPKGASRESIGEVATRRLDFDDFDDVMSAWVPLTLAVNSLNRSMGLPDLYPFAPPPVAVDKLRFVHDVIDKASRG